MDDLVLRAFGEALLEKQAQAEPVETMSASKWKQTAKDVPLAILAGGVGYGIGRTLAEVIGENAAASGQRPGWLKAVPLATSALGALSAYSASQARDGLRKRREAAR